MAKQPADSFGAYAPFGPTSPTQKGHMIGSEVPEEFAVRDYSGYPDDLVMDYRLDTIVPQPQRQVWDFGSEPDADAGSGA